MGTIMLDIIHPCLFFPNRRTWIVITSIVYTTIMLDIVHPCPFFPNRRTWIVITSIVYTTIMLDIVHPCPFFPNRRTWIVNICITLTRWITSFAYFMFQKKKLKMILLNNFKRLVKLYCERLGPE